MKQGCTTDLAPDETPQEYMRRVRSYYSEELDDYLADLGTTWQGGLLRAEAAESAPAESIPAEPTPAESNLRLAARAGIRPGDRVLDAGCGVCGPSLDIVSGIRDVEIEAVTLAADQAACGKSVVAEGGMSHRVRPAVADFHRLPFAGGSFNVVLYLESSGYAYDLEALAAEALRVLRPGGRLYVKGVFLPAAALSAVDRFQFEEFARIYAHRTRPLPAYLRAFGKAGFADLEHCELNPVISARYFLEAMFDHGKEDSRLTPFGAYHHREYFTLQPLYGEIKGRRRR